MGSDRVMPYLTRRTLFTATAWAAASLPLRAANEVAEQSIQDLKRFLGTWRGQGDGQAGHSTVERSYEMAQGDNFILVRNTSTYAPQEKNPKGEIHTDVGYLSFDKRRQQFVLRQFHLSEGFVNQYISVGFVRDEVIFTSEAIENIPAGWRAREIYQFYGQDVFEEIFQLSPAGTDRFKVYSHNRLQRAS
jgi:hypothetical protein